MGNGDSNSKPKTGGGPARAARPSRRLKFSARLRASWWRGVGHLLGADFLWSAALIVVVLLALGVQSCGQEYAHFEVGQLAPSDIKAADDFEFVDVARTDEERQKAHWANRRR